MKLLFEDDKVISKTNDVDSKILGNISSIYLKYTKDNNQNIYSSYSTQPISNIYCTTNLNNIIKEEQILIGKCRLKEEDRDTVFSEFYLSEVDDEKYKEKFNIFEFETEKSTKLELSQLKAILCSIFACNFTSNDRVYIVCDEEGDNYNWRAIDILKQVYKKLPYFMRKSIGYNTYSVGDDEASRIKLAITTRSNSNVEDAYVIDLKSDNCYDVISDVSQKIKNLVDFLLELDDKKLIDIYDEIYNIYGIKNLTIDKFINVFSYIEFYYNSELDDEIIENYIYDIKRANENPEQIDSKLFEKMVSDIKNKLDNVSLNNYIRYNFNNTVDLDNIDSKALDAFQFIYYLGDLFKLDTNLVENWLKKKRIPYLNEKYNASELIKILKNDRSIIEKLETKIRIEDEYSGYENINLMKERAISVIDDKLYELNQEFQIFMKNERNNIKNNLKNIDSLNDILEIVKSINIEYSENQDFFKQQVENELWSIMINYKSYLDIENIKFDDITEDEYNNLCKNIKLYYDNDKNEIEELFEMDIINESTKKSILDGINENLKHDIINLESKYYSNLLLNIKDLGKLGYSFKGFIQKLEYPDINNYQLQKALSIALKKQLNLDRQGYIDINVEELRSFLNEYRDFIIDEDIIKFGYNSVEKKLYSNIDNMQPKISSKSNLDKNIENIIADTIYKVINKDINRFFRSLMIVKQDSDFKNRLDKAKNNYAKLESNEKVFLIFDSTLFRTAEQGFVLTEKYVYYKSSEGKSGKISISDIEDIRSLKNTGLIYINDIPINCDIIGENYRKEFKNLILSIFYLLQKAEDEINIGSIVKEVICFQE